MIQCYCRYRFFVPPFPWLSFPFISSVAFIFFATYLVLVPSQESSFDKCSVSTSSSVCTIAPLGTLSSHRTFSLYVRSPANISRCLSLFSSFLFWSSQSTFQEARLRDPKHYIGDEDSDNFFFFWLLLARRE